MKSEKCKFPKNSKEHLRSRWTLSRRAKLLFPAWAGIVLLSRKPEPELWMFLLRTKFEFTGVVLYFCFPGTWRHRKRSHLSKLIGAFFNWFSGNDVGLRFLGSFLIVQSVVIWSPLETEINVTWKSWRKKNVTPSTRAPDDCVLTVGLVGTYSHLGENWDPNLTPKLLPFNWSAVRGVRWTKLLSKTVEFCGKYVIVFN